MFRCTSSGLPFYLDLRRRFRTMALDVDEILLNQNHLCYWRLIVILLFSHSRPEQCHGNCGVDDDLPVEFFSEILQV